MSGLPLLPPATGARTKTIAWESQGAFAWASVVAAIIAISFYFSVAEGPLLDAVFALSVTLAIGAAIVCIGRRVIIAAVLVVAMVGLIRAISQAKQQANEVLLHAYDLVTFVSSLSALARLWSDHRSLMLGLAIAVAATMIVSGIAVRLETAHVPRPCAACALALLAGIAWTADFARGHRRHTEFYFENTYVTFFYASWSETLQALWRGRLIEAAEQGSLEPQRLHLDRQASCAPATRLPHIILIHQESVVPPGLFPTLSYDRGLDAFFDSFDGKFKKLRVETFGGASWLTEFSLLTGLAAQSFGDMQQFLQHVMLGKVADTLPQALARCGYRNVLLYPMLRHFLGSGRFFEAAGFKEIVDAKAQGARHANERDRFYYANGLALIGGHVKASAQPLFLYIQTMAAHGTYDYVYSPEVSVAGGGPGTPPEMSEYLRRLAMARMDYDFLRSELVRRFPGQAFLIVHYGDHQPTATRSLLGFDASATIEEVLASNNELARTTYYAIDGVGYVPPALPSVGILDVAYLGTVLLEAAGLPLVQPYRERRRLMLLCEGRYYDCPAREEVLQLHRRLIDWGLMKAL